MDETTARFLISEAGAELLKVVSDLPGDVPAQVLSLRKRGTEPALASAAIELGAARHRARKRFPNADRLFFTADALAQATSPVLAAYHAKRLTPHGSVADLCCGVGTDAIAFAEAGARVLAADLDPARLVFAEANAKARGVTDRITFVQADVTDPTFLNRLRDEGIQAAFIDPSRREDSRRVSQHADRYSPPLTFLEILHEFVPHIGVKLSPTLPDDVLLELGGSVSFLSEARECKEAYVEIGNGEQVGIQAILLSEGIALTPPIDFESQAPIAQTLPTTSGEAFLLDPDPAIIRAGALATLCERWDASLVSPDDSYLICSSAPAFLSGVGAYPILEILPYQPKRVAERLKEHGIGRLVVKKRHFPKEPEAVVKELKVPGKGKEGVLVVVRSGSGHLAVLCTPLLNPTVS